MGLLKANGFGFLGRKPQNPSATTSSPEGAFGVPTVATTFTNLLAHVIFSTKHRQPLIDDAWRDDLCGYMGGVIRNRNGILLACGGMPDHVRLLLKWPADTALAALIRDVKSISSGWRHENGDADFGWQTGYGGFSVSESAVPDVTDYTRRQAEHHRRRSFHEGFIQFLDAHQISYDLQYLWN